jgi:hypothetical protein
MYGVRYSFFDVGKTGHWPCVLPSGRARASRSIDTGTASGSGGTRGCSAKADKPPHRALSLATRIETRAIAER